MAKWMVRLAGDEADLKALSALFTEPDCRVVKDVDGSYYLTRFAFATMEGAEVNRAAREWLAIVNPLMGLRNLEPVALDGIYEVNGDGTRTAHHFGSATMRGSGRVRLIGVVLGPDGQPVPSPEPARAQARLRLAEGDTKVRVALSCWRNCTIGDAGFWVYAYKVYEIVRADVGSGDKQKGRQEIEGQSWAPSAEIDGFGEAANNPAVSGETARHGAGWQTRSGVSPLNEGEALAFIQRLLNHWLDWKAEQAS